MFILKLDDKGARPFEDMFYDKYQKINWRSEEQWKKDLDDLWNSTEAIKVSMATYHKLTSTYHARINMNQSKPGSFKSFSRSYGSASINPTNLNTTSINPYPNPSKLANSTGNTLYSLSTDMVRINDTEITRRELYNLIDSTKPASCATCKGYSPMGRYLIPSSDGPVCDWVCLYFCSEKCHEIYSLTGGVS